MVNTHSVHLSPHSPGVEYTGPQNRHSVCQSRTQQSAADTGQEIAQ